MKDKIKILYFMDGIENGGGIQEMAVKWMENIDKNRVRIDILTYNRKKDNYTQRIEKMGGHVYVIHSYVSKKYFLKSFRELKEFFKEHRDYDILHAHSSSKAVFVMLFAKIYGIKIRILHSHCSSFTIKGNFALLAANMLKPITKWLSTDYFACSIKAGRFLFGSKAIDNDRVTIIYNAVNTDIYRFNPMTRKKVRQEFNIDSKIVIGNVSRFAPIKNHSFLLEIFRSICKINNNAVLLLVGSGEMEDQLKKNANHMGISDKVIFLGYRNDVQDIMQAMDILVMPSLYEGLPVTGIEAQAEGLPCVFSDRITNEALLLNEGDFIDLCSSADAWAERILKIIRSYKRNDTKELIVNKGYDIVAETKKMENIYWEKVQRIYE